MIVEDKRHIAIFDVYDTAITSTSSAMKKCVGEQTRYVPADEVAFDALLQKLRSSPE
jgi:hypothetical protein